jgi:hypothetical protein
LRSNPTNDQTASGSPAPAPSLHRLIERAGRAARLRVRAANGIDDILTAQAGIFRRLLLRRRATACMLGENPLRSVLEVVYMAVSPAMRCRGEGRVYRRMRLAWRGFSALTLAVDSANHPAVSLAAGRFRGDAGAHGDDPGDPSKRLLNRKMGLRRRGFPRTVQKIISRVRSAWRKFFFFAQP